MKNIIKLAYFIFLFIIISSCDTDRFFGYNHEADEQLESTDIYGTVTNVFTGEPVEKVNIKFGSFVTRTDKDGYYFTKYALQEDENRNAPVHVAVKMRQYYEFEDDLILYPLSNEYNIVLIYAAPIIVQSTIGTLHPEMIFGPPFVPPMYAQARIRDYQGIETITKVTVTVFYSLNPDEPVEYELELMRIINKTDAFYQFKVPLYNQKIGVFEYNGTFTFRVYDNEGYFQEFSDSITPEYLIFPPK